MKVKYFLSLYLLCEVTYLECTERPIIGILSQEIGKYGLDFYPATHYIASSYVKAVEAAGAKVVPIFIRQNFTYYKNLLYSINGVVLPGGGARLKPNSNGYYDSAMIIYKLAKKMNDEKNFFPIFGVCLGFEALLIISNNNVDMQTRCDVIHENYPLIFAKDFRQSLMFANLPENLHIYLKYFEVTKNNHNWCTTRQNFTKFSLDKEWLITATNVNMRGLEFISSVEHKKYPFIAVQFHPEKQYEWNPRQNNPHSWIGMQANRYFYDSMVILAKLNKNAFPAERAERNALIHNYYPRLMKPGSDFDQIYAFN